MHFTKHVGRWSVSSSPEDLPSVHATRPLPHPRSLRPARQPDVARHLPFGPDSGWGADASESRRIFDRYRGRGGNFIDTANNYTQGSAEQLVGEFIAKQRESVVVATKYSLNTQPGNPNAGGNHRRNMVRSVEASLKRLCTDYIDLLSQTLADLRGWAPLVALQIEYSLIERTGERELLPMARELGLGVLAWSPLAGGVLSGKYTRADLGQPPADSVSAGTRKSLVVGTGTLTARSLDIADVVQQVAREQSRSPAQVALAWTLQRSAPIVMPIIGARTLAQFDDNLGALDVVLEADQVARLDAASAITLGFPHDFIANPMVQAILSGGTAVRRPA